MKEETDQKQPDWVLNFVKYDIATKEFIAYDETQANELSRHTNEWMAAQAVVEHAKKLEQERVNDDKEERQ